MVVRDLFARQKAYFSLDKHEKAGKTCCLTLTVQSSVWTVRLQHQRICPNKSMSGYAGMQNLLAPGNIFHIFSSFRRRWNHRGQTNSPCLSKRRGFWNLGFSRPYYNRTKMNLYPNQCRVLCTAYHVPTYTLDNAYSAGRLAIKLQKQV